MATSPPARERARAKNRQSPDTHSARLNTHAMQALARHSAIHGQSISHVASVGAWFYLLVPPAMAEAMSEAFYQWSQGNPCDAFVPDECNALFRDAITRIEAACVERKDVNGCRRG